MMKDTLLLRWALVVSSSATRNVRASSESEEQVRIPKRMKKS